MDDLLRPERLAEDAVYLGVLTARGLKPLSRIEYAVASPIVDVWGHLGLEVARITRIARNGARVCHLILGRDAKLVDRYREDFDGRLLRGETPGVVRLEARYFGYPACCAEAYISAPRATNHLASEDQALLFHRACPGCAVTPNLIPLYAAALADAKRLLHTARHTRPEMSAQLTTV
jgi:hypothetical protein